MTINKPTRQQIEAFKKMFEYQNQILNATTTDEIKDIAINAYTLAHKTTTPTYVVNGKTIDYGSRTFFEILLTDLIDYQELKKMKVAFFFSLDIIMCMFIREREDQEKIINSILM